MNLNLSKIGRFSFTRRGILCLLLSTYCTMVSAQSFPVQVIPQVLPPAPIYISNYADASTVTSPLRVQIILNDFEIANREIRLKTYFTGSGLSFQSNDIVVGASPLFLEGGIPLVLTNVELAPYFEFTNITGINANQYGNAIPEGAYQFCVEVYDVLTGSRLSNKSCAVSVVFQNEPPFLVLPRNKENVDEANPQHIVFQWTPRSINVSNVEYELSLVEIWDNQVDPQQAFLSSPPVFQTTTTATTYVYGPSDPLLLSGKNYAWRVQAKAKQGTEEIGLFKNEGYSEIYSFSYASSCDLPLAINHEVKGSTNANIFWDDFSTDIPEYTVRYRKKSPSNSPGGGEANSSPSGGGREGDNAWFLSKTTANLLTLWDLKAGTTYEYQVNKKCTVTVSDWSLSKQFTTFIADDEESVYECGIAPDFNITNQDPLQTIGEKFTAGDFPIKVLEASGSNGRFTGKGYVTIPYLSSIKVGVEFTNVLINTDNQLVEGSVITMYDPSLSNILDIDEAIDTVTDAVDAVGDFVDSIGDLFKKKEELLEQIANTDDPTERQSLVDQYNNIDLTIDNQIDKIKNIEGLPEDLKQELDDLRLEGKIADNSELSAQDISNISAADQKARDRVTEIAAIAENLEDTGFTSNTVFVIEDITNEDLTLDIKNFNCHKVLLSESTVGQFSAADKVKIKSLIWKNSYILNYVIGVNDKIYSKSISISLKKEGDKMVYDKSRTNGKLLNKELVEAAAKTGKDGIKFRNYSKDNEEKQGFVLPENLGLPYVLATFSSITSCVSEIGNELQGRNECYILQDSQCSTSNGDGSNSSTTIANQLEGLKKSHSSISGIEFVENDIVYRPDSNGIAKAVTDPLTDNEINEGTWKSEEPEIFRYVVKDGILQLQAFGINKDKVKPAPGKEDTDVGDIAEHIRKKSNEFYKQYSVSNTTQTPTELGFDLNNKNEVFADGDAMGIDNNESFVGIAGEGYTIVKTLVTTAIVKEDVYLSSSSGNVIIHTPGLLTGTIEAGSTVVTDLTSMCVMAYDLSTDKKARTEAYKGFSKLKTAIGDDPKKMAPLFFDVMVSAASGNTPAEWQILNDPSADKGQKSHFGSRGVVMTVKTVFAGGAIIAKLSNITESLIKKIDLQKLIANIGDLSKFPDLQNFLKNASKLPDADLAELTKKFNDIFQKIESKNILESLDKLAKNAGPITGLQNTIKQLHKFKDIDGLNQVIRDMASQSTKYVGSKFMLTHLEKLGDDAIKSIQKFENVLREGENFSADVLIKRGKDLINLEYKSWSKGSFRSLMNAKDGQFLNQLKSYLRDGNFEYIIDKAKLLGKVEPSPEVFVKKEFQNILIKNADTWFKSIENGGNLLTKQQLRSIFGTDNLAIIKNNLNDISKGIYTKIRIE